MSSLSCIWRDPSNERHMLRFFFFSTFAISPYLHKPQSRHSPATTRKILSSFPAHSLDDTRTIADHTQNWSEKNPKQNTKQITMRFQTALKDTWKISGWFEPTAFCKSWCVSLNGDKMWFSSEGGKQPSPHKKVFKFIGGVRSRGRVRWLLCNPEDTEA